MAYFSRAQTASRDHSCDFCTAPIPAGTLYAVAWGTPEDEYPGYRKSHLVCPPPLPHQETYFCSRCGEPALPGEQDIYHRCASCQERRAA